GKHARRELFTRKRRVGDGRLLRIAEAGAHARAVRAGATNNLTGSGERRVVAVLRDDAAELEEQRRVVVPEADDVEQHLRVGVASDRLGVVRSLAADRVGPKAGGAPARQEPEEKQHPTGPLTRSLAADRLGPEAGGAPARQEPE